MSQPESKKKTTQTTKKPNKTHPWKFFIIFPLEDPFIEEINLC